MLATTPPTPPPIIDQVAKPISIDEMVKPTALITWSSLGRRSENQALKTMHAIETWKTHGRPTFGEHRPFAVGVSV